MSKHLPCSGCGIDLKDADTEETTAIVEITAEPVFAGEQAVREVPALVCPECAEVTAL
jgi:hypothetical protein